MNVRSLVLLANVFIVGLVYWGKLWKVVGVCSLFAKETPDIAGLFYFVNGWVGWEFLRFFVVENRFVYNYSQKSITKENPDTSSKRVS
jgi:hypothetical protein